MARIAGVNIPNHQHTVIGLTATVREYQAWAAGQPARNRLFFAAGFTLLFAYFAVTAFIRSRRG